MQHYGLKNSIYLICHKHELEIKGRRFFRPGWAHWSPMDPCGGPVGMYSQTGDWAPESPLGAMKVIFGGPIEAQI